MVDFINEMIYFLTNKPYFKVMVLSNGRRVKKFIQLAASEKKGEIGFLMLPSLKIAWQKPKLPIIDGLKFITFVDINNAIPLEIKSTIEYETNELYIIETSTNEIREDEEKQKEKYRNGEPMKVVQILLPPRTLYETVEANFVALITEGEPDKWAQLKWVFIAGIIVFGFIAWQYISSKGVTGL